MPPIRNITQVTLENLHEMIPEYIHGNKVIIQNYDDMKEVYFGSCKIICGANRLCDLKIIWCCHTNIYKVIF